MREKLFFLLIIMLVALPARAIPAASDGSLETLNQYVAELKKKPEALELRARIISHVQSMKTTPPTPDDAVRALTRGNALLNMAKDKEGFEKAIPELHEAITAAPWLAEPYESIATAQEKAGLFSDAIQNLQYYLLADPRSKNSKEVKKKIYELEVYAEAAGQTVPAPVKAQKSLARKSETVSSTSGSKKEINPDDFLGSWYTAQAARQEGEKAMIHTFTIQRNTKGDMVAMPPRRVTGSLGNVTKFDISGDRVRLQITWKSSSIPNYWKTEDFDLVLSDDGSTLKGKFELNSSGSRDFSDVREYTKQ